MDQQILEGWPSTGTRSTTAGCSATCARAAASCTRGSAACVSSARARATQIVLTTYGRSSGFCVDPIEKKPLNHFLPGTPVLSFGTAGCNLACKFCQNWDISKSREIDTLAGPRLARRPSPTRRSRWAAASVAFTYNDPVIFLEYAIDVADACRERGHQGGRGDRGLHLRRAAARVLRAHGRRQRRPQGLHRGLLPRRSAPASSQPVLDTLEYLRHETDVWFEITTLLIPGENDSDAEIDAMSALDRRASSAPTCRCTSPPSIPTSRCSTSRPRRRRRCTRARRDRARQHGLRYVYTGNVHDPEGGSTYCHGCGRC